MSSSLVPCPSCSRHVRIAENACPFCRTDLAGSNAAASSTGSRAGRAAIFALGASIAIGGCSPAVRYGAPPLDAPEATQDSGTTPDAGTADAASTDASAD